MGDGRERGRERGNITKVMNESGDGLETNFPLPLFFVQKNEPENVSLGHVFSFKRKKKEE